MNTGTPLRGFTPGTATRPSIEAVSVVTYSGYRADEYPRRFMLREKNHVVDVILGSGREMGAGTKEWWHWFRVRTAGGGDFILLHDVAADLWGVWTTPSRSRFAPYPSPDQPSSVSLFSRILCRKRFNSCSSIFDMAPGRCRTSLSGKERRRSNSYFRTTAPLR